MEFEDVPHRIKMWDLVKGLVFVAAVIAVGVMAIVVLVSDYVAPNLQPLLEYVTR